MILRLTITISIPLICNIYTFLTISMLLLKISMLFFKVFILFLTISGSPLMMFYIETFTKETGDGLKRTTYSCYNKSLIGYGKVLPVLMK